MNRKWLWLVIFLGLGVGLLLTGLFLLRSGTLSLNQKTDLLSGFVKQELIEREKPLQKYALPNLHNWQLLPSQLVIIDELVDEEQFVSWQFEYQTQGKKMSGQINWPKTAGGELLPVAEAKGVIVMLRGWVPEASYETGDGTRPAATVFAGDGFITVAPDFLGVAASDPVPEDPWQARFEKPIQVAELIKSIETYPLDISNLKPANELTWQNLPLGMWAHSNGGQIAVTTLMTLQESIPTTLWAPVTAPFPYSILFFSDEVADEGKATRKWLSLFEDDYDAFDFSLSKNLDLLPGGRIQLHHGSADEAALQVWSDEFIQKVELENERRESELEVLEASSAGSIVLPEEDLLLQPIEVTYYQYPGSDHNLRPAWNTVVARDVEFFNSVLAHSK